MAVRLRFCIKCCCRRPCACQMPPGLWFPLQMFDDYDMPEPIGKPISYGPGARFNDHQPLSPRAGCDVLCRHFGEPMRGPLAPIGPMQEGHELHIEDELHIEYFNYIVIASSRGAMLDVVLTF